MRRLTPLALLLTIGLVLPGGCRQGVPVEPELNVVTSTSLLGYIVQEVGGDDVDVSNMVPAAQHPGDFDPKPSDIQKLARASLFMVHGWPGETYVPEVVAAAHNPGLKVVTVSENGSWMTPPVQIAAAEKVAAALAEADPAHADLYWQRAAQYADRVRAKEAEADARLADGSVASVKAIAAVQQAGTAQWMGITVVGSYASAEALTPQTVKDLVDKGRAAGVVLIIDNLHSGKDAGKGLAEELGAKRVVLVYFPGGVDGAETWEKALDYDVDQVLEAIAR